MSKIADFRKSHSEYYLTSKGSSLSAFTQKMLFESKLWSKSPTFLQVVLKILFVGEMFAFLPKKLHNGRISLFLMYFDKGKPLEWAILTFCQTCWEICSFLLKRTSLACENLYKKFLSKNSSLELPDSLCKAQNPQPFATILLQFSPFLEKCDFHFEWKSRQFDVKSTSFVQNRLPSLVRIYTKIFWAKTEVYSFQTACVKHRIYSFLQ